MSFPKQLTREDIQPIDAYAADRKSRKQALMTIKKNRRMEIGPHATFHFESYETMWHQVHEMLYIERGGEAQIQDELEAYNPLIPNGRELVATVMFEISDPVRRASVLSRLGGVEETLSIRMGDEKIMGVAESDVDRTTTDGKASSVQFVHFPFSDAQVDLFRDSETDVIVAVEHQNYAHMAVMPAGVKQALAQDFDA